MNKQQRRLKFAPGHVLVLAAFAFLAPFGNVRAQQPMSAYDSTYLHRNNIKFNVTGVLLYDNVFVFSYERSMNKHQTLAITGGTLQFPSFSVFNLSNTQFEKTYKKSGYTFGAEYRFYLAKENRYAAPHGLYIGPYFSYYHFNNTRDVKFTDSSGGVSEGTLNAKISIANLGVEIGYQFVLWKRFTVDMILFAPSISRYAADLAIDGNINPDHKIEISDEVREALRNHFPMLNKLISEKSIHVSGDLHSKSNVVAPGIRYTVMIGYRL